MTTGSWYTQHVMAATQSKGAQHRSVAADVFAHLLLFLMLYIAAFSFLALLFDYIDVLFEPADSFYYVGQASSFVIGTSALIVVWPVYVVLSWLTGRWIKRDGIKVESATRRWLTYLALFVTAITLIVDLIVLVYNFLSGGLTANFGLKVLAVFVVAAAIFGYYLWDLRRSSRGGPLVMIFAIVASLIVLASVIGGFFIVGTPAEQRAKRFDDRRLSDLYQIQNEAIAFYSNKDVLAKSLSDLENDVTGFVLPSDPETGESYTYTPTGDLTFELCAVFGTEQNFTRSSSATPPEFGYISPFEPYTENWNHPAGEHCFEREVDPELLSSSDPRPITAPEAPEAALPTLEERTSDYTNDLYGFSAELPEGWTYEELSFEGQNDPFCQEPSNMVQFNSPDLEMGLLLGVRSETDDDITIWCRTGIGAGAFVPGDLITIDGSPVEPSLLVYEDRVIEYFVGVGDESSAGVGTIIGDYRVVATINSADVSQAAGDLTLDDRFEDAISILESLSFR